jgi:hypothetical protein
MVKNWTDDRYYAFCTVLQQNSSYYNSKSSSSLDHHIQELHVIEIRVLNGMLVKLVMLPSDHDGTLPYPLKELHKSE